MCIFLQNLCTLAGEYADFLPPDDNKDTVILNIKPEDKLDTITDKKHLPDEMNVNSENTSLNSNKDYSRYNPDSAYSKKTTSYQKEKNFNKVDVGAKYDTTFTPENASQTETIYTKYHVNDKMSVGTSYKNSSQTPNQVRGTVAVTPEYRLNQHFAVQSSFSENFSNRSTKEGVSLELNPLKDKDRMEFDVGAAQVQYDNGSPTSSQINFGTSFRF